MSITSLIATFIIVATFLMWIASPFFQRSRVEIAASVQSNIFDRQRERLMIYYGRVLRNIHDLDEDFATGKLDAAEYERDRALWVERGVQVLKAVDGLDSQLVAPDTADDAAIDAAIDRAIEEACARGAAVMKRIASHRTNAWCLVGLIFFLFLTGCGGLGGEPEIAETLVPPAATEEAVVPPVSTEEVFAPESTEESVATVRVVGRILNGTAGGIVPDALPVNLSIIDEGSQTVQPYQTLADAEGDFVIENVEISPSHAYVAVTRYRERNFASFGEVSEVENGILELTLTIHELTEDPAVLSIVEAYLTINPDPVSGNLVVLQSMRFRNASDRLFTTSVSADADSFVAIVVNLPVGAVVTGFINEQRYLPVTTEQLNVVIDTLPVLPGEDHLIVLSYLVPYNGDDGAIIDFPVNYALDGEVQLFVGSENLNITSDQLQAAGTDTIETTTYQVYSGILSLLPRDSVRFEVSGSASSGTSADSSLVTSNNLLPILFGIGVLIILMVVGLLALRNRGQAIPTTSDQVIEGLVRQIADLDAQHDRGEINHDLYQRRRGDLKAQLAQLMEGGEGQ